MALLIRERGNAEGTVEKAKTVVRSTWTLLDDPAAVTDKLTKAAAKINKPKAKAGGSIWDVGYLHEYLHGGEPIDAGGDDDFKEVVENTILKVRAQSGWRSGDLCGLFDCGLTWLDTPGTDATHGVQVRLWDTKTRKNAWSAVVFFPRLSDKYASLCVYRALRKLTTLVSSKRVDTVKVASPVEATRQVQARPLMIYPPSKAAVKRGDMLFKRLAEATIATYFKKAFLANMADGQGRKYDKIHNAHSARHAVASRLADMGVPAATIAGLTLNSAEILAKTYIVPVQLEWATPSSCVEAQALLPAKILLPYVHYVSTKGVAGAACDCAKLLQQVPPS